MVSSHVADNEKHVFQMDRIYHAIVFFVYKAKRLIVGSDVNIKFLRIAFNFCMLGTVS